MLLRERIGMGELRAAAAGGWKPLPRDHGRLSALQASYSYLRQFTPDVLAVVGFQGGPGTAALMEAVEILKELNRQGSRKVPEDAPASLCPPGMRSTWRRPGRPGMTPPTGTTGSCA